MKTKIVTTLIMGIATLAFGQGSLTPPGFPAPTMKTLAELDAAIGAVSNALEKIQDDPRTPLVAGSPGVTIDQWGTIIIDQSGSYYLTTNRTVNVWDGIQINASGVTIDLQGFTIRSTAPTYGCGIGIRASHVSIFNGHIVSGTVYDSGVSGDQYTGSGFNYGIYADSDTYTSIRIRDVSVSGCNYSGIYIASNDSLVESCTVEVVGSAGIRAGMVNNCSATTCGGKAIEGSSILNCKGISTASYGIFSHGTVRDSYGETSSTSSRGIHANKSVQNSTGKSEGGHGITSGMVNNSYGITSSTSTGSHGIWVDHSVQDSYGSSAGGNGIYSSGTVANSYGYTSGTSTSSEGIYANRSVKNSFGISASVEGGDGIRTTIVSDSYGYSQGTNALADGIQAHMATSCYMIGGGNITYKYNMP